MDSMSVKSREELIGYIYEMLDEYDQCENRDVYTFPSPMKIGEVTTSLEHVGKI
jgi:hypothetical protein